MEITEAQYQRIEHCLPRQRGNVSLANLQVLNAFFMLPSMAVNGAVYPSVSVDGTRSTRE
jgi:hypothetical protein